MSISVAIMEMFRKKLIKNMSAPTNILYGMKDVDHGKISVRRPEHENHALDALRYASQPLTIAGQLRAKLPHVNFDDVNMSVDKDVAHDRTYLVLRRRAETLAVELELLKRDNYDCPISEENLAKIVLIFG